jgi:hypothetical protein
MARDELQLAATIETYADREKLFIFEAVTRYNSGIFSDKGKPLHTGSADDGEPHAYK